MDILEIISIGHNNFIPCSRISLILQISSRPIRSLISKAREEEKLVDATSGKKTKSVIVTNDGFVVLCAITPKTLAERYQNEDSGSDS
jgi:regulator of extracellular matrix RemA (YlzA/DUF370 family)